MSLWSQLVNVVRGDRLIREIDEELESHVEEAIAQGRDADEARRALGSSMRQREASRDIRRIVWLGDSLADLRHGARTLRRTPRFAAIAIVMLALGIGANTAVFSILDSLTLRRLPVREPDRLAALVDGSWSYLFWEQIRARANDVFDGALAWAPQTFDLSLGGPSAPVDGAYVSGRFFDVLGVSATLGRMLAPFDDSRTAPDRAVAVISSRLWKQRFSGAADVVGRQLAVQHQLFTIVGIMPPEFFGVDVGRGLDVVVPLAAEPLIQGRSSHLSQVGASWLEVMVRLKPGQSVDEANIALRGVQPQIRAGMLAIGEESNARYLTDPLTLAPAATGRSALRAQFETPLIALAVAAALVLLVACANLASLLLERAVARRHELSVRLALGGSRWRLARLLFSETLVVVVVGATLGVLLALWSSAALVEQLNTWRSTVSLSLGLNWRVLGFAATAASLSALVAGLVPVLGVKGLAPSEALGKEGRAIVGGRRLAVGASLVVAQIAVSLVLVVGTGLFVRTFTTLNQLPLGFTSEPLLLAELNLQQMPREERSQRIGRLRDAASAVPGVNAVAVSVTRPLTGGGWGDRQVVIGDSPMGSYDRRQPILWLNATTPGWFQAMGIAMTRGRDFTADDRLGSPPVVIVNESFTRRYLAGREPIGQVVRLGVEPTMRYEIVGLVGDTVYTSPRDGMAAMMYLPVAQRKADTFWSSVLLTMNVSPGRRAAAEREVAAALQRFDPTLEFTFRTYDQLVDATITQERLVAMLAGFFGGFAVLLAGIGLYGMVDQAVRARRSEIGLRMALGARPSGIVRLVFQRVGVLIASGLALGIGISLWAAHFVARLLFQVEARDPATLIAAVAVLVAVGVFAVWVPARRATRLDPSTVLREG